MQLHTAQLVGKPSAKPVKEARHSQRPGNRPDAGLSFRFQLSACRPGPISGCMQYNLSTLQACLYMW